ncbi:LpqN/LpqT family lipoprotein [Mycolicibacterium austroafricanum]|uniref:LpqN/LpqT family lipoprotein n=1 Tax=Mycolicibacterium austroafricanum TaxID=39687 RepID=UPI001CA31EDD|nr:LpqN/LpqT family lipoprotein [Mycolicibacterium austroafricanum]QZT62878.1 LpqN/LpqT family lipoprotein [Mycolicibacterium austroafricanum]
MSEIARHWRVLAGGIGACAAGVAGVLGVAASTASAQPMIPQPPLPAPATVTHTVVVTPDTAPAALGQPGVTPATTGVAAVPAGVSAGISAPAAPALPTRPVSTLAPATSGTLAEFFAAKGVAMEPQSSRDFRALNIVLPKPRGWEHIPDPNVPDAFAVLADRVGGNGLYSSNAQVVVYKLVGAFDPKEAISHGFIDSQKLPAWRSTDASLADFGGMPSSLIEGTYRENNLTLNTSRRHVIATVGPDSYLVSLSVTTSVDQVVAAADATEAIVNGFRVGVPGPAPVAPLPGTPALPLAVAPPTAPAVPAVAPAPQLLGLQG